MSDKLTPKQRMFVAEYICSLNSTEAAKKAGYSPKTAMEQGYQLLQKTSVQTAIQEQMDARSKRTLINADYVLNGIKNTVDAADNDFVKLKGFELLGKHLKLFTDKTELTGKDGGAVQVQVALPDHLKYLAE